MSSEAHTVKEEIHFWTAFITLGNGLRNLEAWKSLKDALEYRRLRQSQVTGSKCEYEGDEVLIWKELI